MMRWLALLPFLLLIPEAAHAAALGDVIATVISYSKWLFILVGVGLILRIVVRASQGQPIGPGLRLAVGMTLVPTIILSIVDAAGTTGFTSSAVAASGRSYVEYMMSQAGLLSGSLLASWPTYSLILIAVVFGSAAATAAKAHGKKEEESIEIWKAWLIPSILIFAIFNPFLTVKAPGTSGGLIYKISGTKTPKTPTARLAPMGGSITGLGSAAVLGKISQQPNIQLIKPAHAHTLEVPLILSKVDAAMSQLVGSIVDLFARKNFALFGMVSAKSTIARLDLNIGNPDLQRRLNYFIRNCYTSAVMQRMNHDPQFAQQWAKAPRKIAASLWNPFSTANMAIYRQDACRRMVKGGYNFGYPQGSSGGIQIVKGRAYPHPLGDEILGNLAFNDLNLRQQYKWNSVDAAIANVNTLKNAVWNRPSSDFYFQKMSDALIADVITKSIVNMPQTLQVGGANAQVQVNNINNTNPVVRFLKTMGMAGFQTVSTAKAAAESEMVNLEMPLWMGGLQMILLALFPIVFLLALMPGMASTIGWYLLTLLWARSYIIAWALVSNLDAWQMEINGTTAQNLAMSHTIEQLQLYSPLAMALVIFGPKVAAYSLSRGGGGA